MYSAQGEIAFGNQIRNYVFMPYTLVKDLRTGMQCHDVEGFLDEAKGLDMFMESAVLKFGNMPDNKAI